MARMVTLVPSAQRLMSSLRDIGYDLPTAVADLVDNSIAANATDIRIEFRFLGDASWIRLADNGRGMSGEELDEAMRYGTRRTYDNRDLGRFGLGLKTASLSQCRRLTVASRRSGGRSVTVRQWDHRHLTDAWEALVLEPDECPPEFTEPLTESHGTVVVWDYLDRILQYRLPEGKSAKDALLRLSAEVGEHLAMVFHRFLSGEARRRTPCRIVVNGEPLVPWDPFVRAERATQVCRADTLEFVHVGRRHTVTVSPYILPNEADFSQMSAHGRAAGPNRWNRQQGFYIYRNDRMIQSGGWNRLRVLDEHTKLARVALEFGSSADEAFGINVAKMRVQLPEALRRDLVVIANAVAQRANMTYRGKDGAPRGSSRGTSAYRSASGTGAESGALTPEPGKNGAAAEDLATASGSGKAAESTRRAMPDSECGVARRVVEIVVQQLWECPDELRRVLEALRRVGDEFEAEVDRRLRAPGRLIGLG